MTKKSSKNVIQIRGGVCKMEKNKHAPVIDLRSPFEYFFEFVGYNLQFSY